MSGSFRWSGAGTSISPNNRGSAFSTARRIGNGPRLVTRFNKNQCASQPIRRLAAAVPISMSAPHVIQRPKQKAPLGTGRVRYMETPNRSQAIIEALPQIGCRSPATLDAKSKRAPTEADASHAPAHLARLFGCCVKGASPKLMDDLGRRRRAARGNRRVRQHEMRTTELLLNVTEKSVPSIVTIMLVPSTTTWRGSSTILGFAA